MASTTVPTTISHSAVRPVWRTGAKASVVAGLATSAFAGAAHGLGVSLDVSGAPIPVTGFAVMTVLFATVGIGLAAVLARRVTRARRAFLITTLGLTALSFVPDLTADAMTSTKLVLMTTHVLAAAIVIPALAGRSSDR